MNINYWIPPENGNKFVNAAAKHNAIANEYEAQYETDYWRLYDELTWDHMSEFILNNMKSDELMLDAGGGTGKWSRGLLKSGIKKSKLIDLAEKMMQKGYEYAKQEKLDDRIEFIKSDIKELPFENETFDVVISQGNPICYCDDPYRAIKELARVAKSGAPVVLSTHNKLAMITYFGFFMGKLSIEDIVSFAETSKVTIDYPIYAFTPDELRKVCEDNGLIFNSLIGKPTISGFVQSDGYLNLLKSKDSYKKVVELEKKYWQDSSILGMAGHIQIACIKK